MGCRFFTLKTHLFTIYWTNCLFSSAYNNKDGSIFVCFCIFLVSGAVNRDQERLQEPIQSAYRFSCPFYENKHMTLGTVFNLKSELQRVSGKFVIYDVILT